jgi:hypothetical protein
MPVPAVPAATHFGTLPGGQTVEAYRLSNPLGTSVTVLTYGGIAPLRRPQPKLLEEPACDVMLDHRPRYTWARTIDQIRRPSRLFLIQRRRDTSRRGNHGGGAGPSRGAVTRA